MLAALKPFGVWGIGALAVIDSAAIPVPIDALLIDYVANDHATVSAVLLYGGGRFRRSAAWCRTTWGVLVASCFC